MVKTRMSTAARRALVWPMKVSGMGYGEIADSLKKDHGINVIPATIANDCNTVLAEVQQETRKLASGHRTMMLERIETGLRAIFDKVIKGELDAIHAMVRLMEREAKLTGADMPAKIDIEHRIRTAARERGLDEDEAVRGSETVYQEQRKLLTAG